MGFFKKYPIFCVVLLLLLLVLGGGIYLVLTERAKAEEARDDYESEIRRLEQVSRGVPYESEDGDQRILPNAENRKVLEERLAQVTGDLQRIRQGMAARSGNLLGDTADEFTFLPKLQSFIASLKAKAAANEIQISRNEAFGFASYATRAEQPPTDKIPELNLQRQVLDYIVKKLIDAGPTAILAVERELVEADETEETDRNRDRGSIRGNNDDDVFTIEELVTARSNEYIETSAFRLVFTGRTDVLRQFLNTVGRFEIPLIVRSVQVEPTSEEDQPEEEEAAPTDNQQDSLLALFGGDDESEETEEEAGPESIPGQDPVITENQSKFTVVIEYVEVLIEESESTEEGNS